MLAAGPLVETLLEYDYFGPGAPFPFLSEKGDGASRLIVITGDNASGKSFMGKLLRAVVKMQHDIECIHSSMLMRTTPGIGRAFMYGDEDWESTGLISVKNVRGCIRTARERQKLNVVLLDEPDIGLSEGYAAAIGRLIGEYAANPTEMTKVVVVVSHSRPLIQGLLDVQRRRPHHVRLGDDLRPLAQWLEEGALPRSLDDLEQLGEIGTTRMRAVHRLIESRKA